MIDDKSIGETFHKYDAFYFIGIINEVIIKFVDPRNVAGDETISIDRAQICFFF